MYNLHIEQRRSYFRTPFFVYLEVMTMKPVIGIVPLVDIERESYWMLPGYMKAIEKAGGISVMLPLTYEQGDLCELLMRLDGILFTGGQDIFPFMYKEKISDYCGQCCFEKDEMEFNLFQYAYDLKLPMLGICRGHQLMNVMMNGTLYQDINSQMYSRVKHHQSMPYDKPIHDVEIAKESPLYELLGKETISVNSLHHQGIKDLGQGLQAMATSKDGLIEAICAPDYPFMWGFQWHPEFSYKDDYNSQMIFKTFVDHCKKETKY
jgi:putative glutamine amidotransferase